MIDYLKFYNSTLCTKSMETIKSVTKKINTTLSRSNIDDNLTFWRRIFFLILAHPVYKNVNNTGTKYVTIMKQTAF